MGRPGKVCAADRQQLLPFPVPQRTADDWSGLLAECLQRPVRVQYGRSRRVPVRVQPDTDAALQVRLHGFFAAAPPEIADALGRWLRVGGRARRAATALDTWIERQVRELRPTLRTAVQPRGATYDLDRLARLVIAEHLGDLSAPPPRISWGRRARSRSVRTLHLGSYDPELHLVRLHPVLDHADVPEFFVRFVLFHELLHARTTAHDDATDPRSHHPPEFRRRERAHPDYRRAVAWESANLPRLIRRARRGC